MATKLEHTVKPSGGDFTTLDAALDHLVASHANLVTADVYAEIKIDGTWSTADTAPVTIAGLTTDATRYLKIYTTAAARHKGVWSTGYYMLNVANATAITWTSVSNVWIDGLQIGKSSESAHYQDCIQGSGSVTETTNEFLVSNCIGRHAKNNSYRCMFLDAEVVASRIFLYNIIDYNHGTAANQYNCSVYVGNGEFTCYNCTFIGGYRGIRAGVTGVAKNCYAYGSNAAYSGTITKTTCASSDTTGTAGLQSIAVNASNFLNVTAGTEDFHLAGTGSALFEAGTDTSGDSAPMNFTTDIDGETRG
jgi:hypothetical protein